MDYASYGEAPKHMYFWAGVSAVAGALRRQVWIDQAYFKWHPNFYICFVAPPGIVSKSTTAGVAMNLLRRVPDIKFGPDVVTWPALVEAFAGSTVAFEYEGAYWPMSAMTLESSEFGNLLNPQDKEMVDLLVSLWDGKAGEFKKATKNSGNDSIPNPWINLIACTTPAWIAGNFPEYMIGGGFTSRTIFVYADKKGKYVAYPGLQVPPDLSAIEDRLVADLTHISKLVGEYRLSPAAVAWGEAWYTKHYSVRAANLDPDRFGGYLARKQTHIHKLAIVLAASGGDELIITDEHLEIAHHMITDLEPDMQYVFAKIGRSQSTQYMEMLVNFVAANGKVLYKDAYKHVHSYFPSMRDFDDMMAGVIRAGFVELVTIEGKHFVTIPRKEETAA
ncbi:hypothetical protein [Bacteriophage sp.]|nr:hypothetical protein [Bacteriophage sp.]